MDSRTVSDALKVVVTLSCFRIGPDKFVVYFVLDIAQKDKRRHDSLASTRLQCCRDFPIPHVCAGG